MKTRNQKRILLLAAGAAAAMLCAGCAQTAAATESAAAVTQPQAEETAAAADTASASVTVTAEVTDYADPDTAQIILGVEQSEDTAEKAQENASAKTDAVKAAIEKLGISEDSISTSSYSMYPQYNYDGTKVTGYTVNVNLTVRDAAMDQVGEVLTQATKAGATQVIDLSYTSSSYDEVYAKALTRAAGEAQTKAQTMAAAEDRTLGDLISVQEGYQDTSARYQSTNSYATMEDTASTGSISLDPGKLEIQASVTAVYALD